MITAQQFQELHEQQNDYAVSIFTPTYRDGHEEEDRIRFKNSLKEARNELVRLAGLSEGNAEAFLKQGYDLLENTSFWSEQSDGLAVYIGPDHFSYYTLPIDFDPYVHVGKRFYLHPVLPALNSEQQKFFLLTISQGKVRFFEATPYSITPIDISENVPANMADALMMDDPGKSLQHHSAGTAGKGNTIFHGHGHGEDDENAELKVYFDRVDKGISDLLCDDDAPLLLAGVDKLIPIYRDANSYNFIIENKHVSGNVDEDNPALLHEKAMEVMDDFFDQQRRKDLQLFEDNLGQGEGSFDVNDVIPAAINGRAEALFIAKGKRHYGSYDQSTNSIKLSGDEQSDSLEQEELLERAAVATYLAGGRVYQMDATDMPRPTSAVAAIYRYNY